MILLVALALAGLGAATCEDCARQIDETVAKAKTTVVELQTEVAPTPIPENLSGGEGNGSRTEVNLRVPPKGIQDKQNIRDRRQIWVMLSEIAANERGDFGARFPDERDCYLATMNASFQVATDEWAGYAIQTLAGGIAAAPLGVISTGTLVGDVSLHIASYLIDLGFSTDWADTTIEFVARESAGFVLGRAVGDFGKDIATSRITADDVKRLLEHDDVIGADANGHGVANRWSQIETEVHLMALYNPYTHYVTASIASACGGSFLIRYEADEDARAVSAVDIISIK